MMSTTLLRCFLINLCICILVCLTIVTSKLHTIIMSCYLMFVAISNIVVEDTEWRTINTVFTRLATQLSTFFNSKYQQLHFYHLSPAGPVKPMWPTIHLCIGDRYHASLPSSYQRCQLLPSIPFVPGMPGAPVAPWVPTIVTPSLPASDHLYR